ncbi:magnesium transporter [Amycolatopsis xylanica]|uniref:Magnesium transporter n=1 Tax=Amycolatopsis xylanica TaxID=589385 RepID=A0A1H3H7E5_9PSEU|nr:magnesium transporter CorA family protein [Amycolatopsis xylanica]SDY10694.1 magnesium transporter [Amycolatopsis xylanica]
MGTASAGNPDTMSRTRLYRDGVLEAEDFPVDEVSKRLDDPAAVVWLDLCDPTEDDFATIADELSLHRLAVEDALHARQRPKLDRYEKHSFLNTYAVRFDSGPGQLDVTEISAFITENALVTVHKSGQFDIDALTRRWDEADNLAKAGVGFLVHGLLDYVVDGQFEAVQALDEQLEELEDLVFDDSADHAEVQQRSSRLRKSLVALRRVVLPMREVVDTLMRRGLRIVDDELAPYFEDVRDHVRHASEWTDSLRELVATIRETQLNIQGNRLNIIMKKVTSWAAIIAVPTAITGFYGQNVPYPGFEQSWGFWVSTVAIIAVSAGLYTIFKRRDWL